MQMDSDLKMAKEMEMDMLIIKDEGTLVKNI